MKRPAKSIAVSASCDYEFDLAGTRLGIVGCAVGAPYAVLVAEQMFSCGCELLLSVTSSGQIAKGPEPPYFVLVTRALRDEGRSYHYQPIARFATANPARLERARSALHTAGVNDWKGQHGRPTRPSERRRPLWRQPNRMGSWRSKWTPLRSMRLRAHEVRPSCASRTSRTQGDEVIESLRRAMMRV